MNFTERLRTTLGLSEAARGWMVILVWVFIFAFLARLAVLIFFIEADPGFMVDNDSIGYLQLAENMEAGIGFAWDTGMPFTYDSFRTPAYPAFLYAHHIIFGSFVPAAVTQIILSLLIGLLIVKIADRYLRAPRAGIVAAALFFFMPFSLLVTERYLTQILYTAVVMCAAWFWLEYLANGRAKKLFVTGILVPLSALVRPISIFFTAPFIASLALGWFWKKIELKRAAVASGVVIILFLIVIVPWIWRNYKVFGYPYLSSITAVQLYFYDAPAVYATAQNIGYEEARTALNSHIAKVTGKTFAEDPVSYTELSAFTPILKEEGMKFFLADPWALIKTRAVQFFKFFTRDGIRYWLERYGIDTYSGWALVPIIAERAALLILTLGFFFYAVREFFRKNLPATALTLIVMYFAVLSGVMSSAGLRFPAEPLYLLLGVVGIYELYSLAKHIHFQKKTQL